VGSASVRGRGDCCLSLLYWLCDYNCITIAFLLMNLNSFNDIRFNTLSRWLVSVKLVNEAYVTYADNVIHVR
jgi:hypothetical protein